MFLICPTTKTSLTFLIAILGWEILNNIGKQFCRKVLLSHHFVGKIVANQKYV